MDEVTRLPAPPGAGTPATAGGRRRAIEHPGRFAIVAVGLMLVGSLAAIAIGTADTKEVRKLLPPQVQSVSPPVNTIVPPQERIQIDLRDDLTGRFVVEGPSGDKVAIPDDQVSKTPGIQVLTFQPGPGQEIERYDPGINTVTVYFQRLGDPTFTDVGSYSWTFISKS